MPRPRQRVCLQDGLKLDLNKPCSEGFGSSRPSYIRQNHRLG
jgi:hypothetical protein